MKKLKAKIVLLIVIGITLLSSNSYANYMAPVPKGSFAVTSKYGKFTHETEIDYYAIDLQMSHSMDAIPDYSNLPKCLTLGAPILAAKSGFVDTKGISTKTVGNNYGNSVEITNDDGTKTLYGHMIHGSLAVKENERVEVGQILGLMGDTGLTFAGSKDVNGKEIPCASYNGLDTDPRGGFYGIHLHIRTTDKDGGAILTEPLIGTKNYTDVEKGTYTSKTIMYDPRGHWAKWSSRVPYRLTYSPTKISGLYPLKAKPEANQIFTIQGESLFDELKVTLPGCRNFTWLKREANEQQFSCDFSGRLTSEATLNGVIYFNSASSGDVYFDVEISEQPDEKVAAINRVDVKADAGGKPADFNITGDHLPGDLRPEASDCGTPTYRTIKPNQLEFSCDLPTTVIAENGRRANGEHTFSTQLVSRHSTFQAQTEFKADYYVTVDSFGPGYAKYGVKNIFTITGKNLHLARAYWIEKCHDVNELEHTETLLRFSCVPDEPTSFIPYYFTGDDYKKDLIQFILKDVSGGNRIFSTYVIVGNRESEAVVQVPESVRHTSKDGHRSDNEMQAIIDELIANPGVYSNELLETTGWERVKTSEGIKYQLKNCNAPGQGNEGDEFWMPHVNGGCVVELME